MSSIFVENPRESVYSGPTAPEYIVSFSYSVAGRTYSGSYRAGSPSREGHHFEISYDPNNPGRNTATELMDTPVGWLIKAALVFGAVVAAVWFSRR
jgi:hypothetical protein